MNKVIRKITRWWWRNKVRPINWLASRWATKIHWKWEDEDVSGVIRVTRGGYGAYVSFPEICEETADVALFDLYYRSEDARERHPDRPFAVHLYPTNDWYGDPEMTLYYIEGEEGPIII